MPSLSRLVALVGVALAVTSAPAVAESRQATRPNVVIILLDDAGYADFGFMGSRDIPTPEIDRLAADGVVLRDFHVTATVCAPSRAGLIAGRYQHRFGFEANLAPRGLGIPPTETTLPEALRAEGYRTILVGKWHLGSEATFHPENHGFDAFHGILGGGRSYFPSAREDRPRDPRVLLDGRVPTTFEGYFTDVLTDRAIAAIDAAGDQPFFLLLAYTAPHTPMEAKPELLARFAGHPRATYAAMLASVDENVGRLRAALAARGVADDTLVMFLSDNGGDQGNTSSNAPLKGWKGNKFEGGHRVPAIVSWPSRLPRGTWHDGLASALDLYPTAVAAARGKDEVDPALDGINLLPILEGRSTPDPRRALFWRKDGAAAVRLGTDKLIRLDGFGYRFYDLSADPGETTDLSASEPGRAAAALAALRSWEATLPPPLWYEDDDWTTVTWEIHEDLLLNREPRWKTPAQRRAAQAAAQAAR